MKDEVEITVIATKFEKPENGKTNFKENRDKNGLFNNSGSGDDDFFIHLTNKLNNFNND